MVQRAHVITAIIVAAVLAVAYLGVSSIAPRFASSPCDAAAVVLYRTSFSPAGQALEVDVANRGSTPLALTVFLRREDGSIWTHPTTLYLSAGGRSVFSLGGVAGRPAEVTVRDQACGVADLSRSF